MTSRYQLDRSDTAKRSSDCRGEVACRDRALCVRVCLGPLSGPQALRSHSAGAHGKGRQNALKTFGVL